MIDDLWYRLRQDGQEPDPVASPDEFQGGSNLNVVCTQLVGRSSHQQRKLVDAWCEALPDLEGVRTLWFHSRVPERLFEAACAVPGLETLFIKWSGVKSLEPVAQMSSLRNLFLGSAPGVESLEPLGHLSGLRWLTIENHWRAGRLDPLSRLTRLEGLSITGRSRTHIVDSLAPIGELARLRYLDLVDLRAKDGTLRPLYALTNLETFESARWWPDEELAEIHRRNPGLRE